ncbi:MAG TPA: response regulator transcription factor [Pyrinomonadaceae bacterium]|jgi:DNA-binding NarL/FixJ family response regulator|nr:response regulator transcription factor [Pyrinomonadaceae bacterium]
MPHTGKPIRVLIVDDHKIIRDGLRDLISSRRGMTVVGDAGNRAEALRLAASGQPHIIVLDLDLGQESGLDLIVELREAAGEVGIIILTGLRDTEKRDRAMELGAKGVVLKEEGATELLSAIEKVARTGEYWLEAGAARRLLSKRQERATEKSDPEAAKIARLTEREREIIALVGEGLENKEIAERLRPVVAEATVRNNLSTIYDKLDIKGGRLGLLVYAYKHKLILPS